MFNLLEIMLKWRFSHCFLFFMIFFLSDMYYIHILKIWQQNHWSTNFASTQSDVLFLLKEISTKNKNNNITYQPTTISVYFFALLQKKETHFFYEFFEQILNEWFFYYVTGSVLPQLYNETQKRKELIREVEMGPFKHEVDDGTFLF